jgi:[acyl-carrier-protein] S-malonyltransferase
MKTLIFPGQGSQSVGMGQDLYKTFDLVKKIFKEADEKLKYPISKIILEGPESDLKLTKNTQPAILTVSYSIFRLMTEEFNIQIKDIKYFAGHSLGEYSALVSSKSLSFSDAVYLLHERGKSMQEAVPEGKGSMLAVMGLKIEDLEKYIGEIRKEKGVCEIANDNSDGQVILSGDKFAIDEISKILKNDKKKSIFLPVSAPFHCSLMNPAAKIMEGKINQTNFKNPLVALVSNVTAEPVKDSQEIKSLLIKQIFSKVKWRESVLFMIKNGVNEFIEIGPGKVLSGLVKRISDKVLSKSINTIEDIKSLK